MEGKANLDLEARHQTDAPDRPLVSVVIPARHAQDTLSAALDCLIGQTYPYWHAIVIDDGSRDGTAALLSDYTARDTRITCVAGPATGVSSARNLGLASATGRWVLFLDADDWVDSHFLERMLAALDGVPQAVAAYCGSRRVLPNGQMGKVVNDDRLTINPVAALARSNQVAIHAVLVERAAIEAVGGFDPSLQTCEDWDLWQRVARLGRPWVQVHETLSYYRMQDGSLTRDLPQLLADAETVIRRGFADDAGEGAAGAPPTGGEPLGSSIDEAVSTLALWFGTVEALRGGSGVPALRSLSQRPPLSLPAAQAAIVDAISVAMNTEPEKLAKQWPAYAPALIEWLSQVGAISVSPVEARRLQYGVERHLIQCADPAETVALDLTLGLSLNPKIGGSGAVSTRNIDRLLIRVPGRPALTMDLGVLGDLSRARRTPLAQVHRRWIQIVLPASFSLLPHAAFKLGKSVARARRTALDPSRLRQLIHQAGAHALQHVVERALPETGHTATLNALRSEAEALALAEKDARPGVAMKGVDWSSVRTDGTREMYWDDVFRDEDPWNYASAYEQEKYDRQMDIMPEGSLGTALELACAEGLFTQRLAPRAKRVIATDISRKALERAKARCTGLTNITFQQLDLIADPLPQQLDLIVCSEVLYFTKVVEELEKVARRFVSALKPGGHIVTAHAQVLKDDPARTGFDWGSHPFGAEVISGVLGRTPGLALERTLQSELYRIDRYVRTDARTAPEPVPERVTINAPIDPEVRRYIVWGGATVTRLQAQGELRRQIPVLMYHRIAEDGPEALRPYRVPPEMFREQIRWLRRNGYHTIASHDLPLYLRQQTFRGRPVVISFDDGFQDFADVAWPVLHDHDFVPEVFIVSDLIGKTSEWDARLGGAFPLMNRQTLGRLRDEGVHFGSHLASHRAAEGLSTRDLASELLRSRALIGKWLGVTPQSFAAPFGSTDERVQRLAAECGYSIGFGTHPGGVSAGCNLLNLPRIQVTGDWTMDTFVQTLEAYL